MALFANQRTIEIVSSSGTNTVSKPYGIVTRREQQIAYHILDDKRNSTPIMLFFELALHQNGHKSDFSPASLSKQYGISADRWRKAFSILVDKGYLTETGRNHYIFNSLPERYKDVVFSEVGDNSNKIQPENNQTQNAIPADGYSQNKSIIDAILADGDNLSLPTGVPIPADGYSPIPADEESNKKDNKYIINDNIKSVVDIIDPEEKELNDLAEAFEYEFGHLDKYEGEILNTKCLVPTKHRSISERIKYLKKRFDYMIEERERRKNTAKYEYRAALNRLLPKDSVERAKLNLIIKRYVGDHNTRAVEKAYKDYGLFIDGWNEERQEPNVIIALYPLPIAVLEKLRHNIEGIPKEYYAPKKERNDTN